MLVALVLVMLHGPGGNAILINPDAVTTMHVGRGGDKNQHVTENAKCLINTADGKFVAVIETCDKASELFRQSEHPP